MQGIIILVLSFSISLFAANPPTGKYKTILDKLQKIHTQYPNLTSLFSIGENDDGVEMVAMRISLTPEASDLRKVGHLIVGTHHGNEAACPPLVLNFIEKLLKRYESRDLFETALADTEWTLVPVLNISGYNAGTRHEHGRDPNRDYQDICTGQPSEKLKSIRNIVAHMKTRIYTGSVTVHGYVGSLTYPWGVNVANTHTLDHNEYEKITQNAAEVNNYRYGTSTDIVYPADGTYEDYVYWKHGMWSILLELRNGSQQDIESTTQALFVYFNQLTSSPSNKHDLTSQCQRAGHLDLANE